MIRASLRTSKLAFQLIHSLRIRTHFFFAQTVLFLLIWNHLWWAAVPLAAIWGLYLIIAVANAYARGMQDALQQIEDTRLEVQETWTKVLDDRRN